jgi:hypothetical protein
MKKIILLILMCLAVYSHASNAASIGVDNVYGENSLYNTDWGHSYNVSGGGNESDALGRGDPAEAWQNTPGHAYGFSSSDNLLITATGCVVDKGTACTGPDYLGGDFRGLPVYSLIGIWSNDANTIAPINSPFLVGALLNLIVPDNGLSPLYLFLATNDGIFSDNYSNYTYSVSIDKISNVPLPATFWLMVSGLLFIKRLRNK